MHHAIPLGAMNMRTENIIHRKRYPFENTILSRKLEDFIRGIANILYSLYASGEGAGTSSPP